MINNSFGESDFEIDGYGNSWDFDTLVIDLLSLPGVVHPSYPGTIFLVSAGNGGPGYGTVTSPASSSASISVGASTALHPFEDLHGPQNQGFDKWLLGFRGTTDQTVFPKHMKTVGASEELQKAFTRARS